jgi:hypothetical protein
MKFLAVFKLVLAIFPNVIDLIKAAEAMMPEPGRGAEKLEYVRSVLQDLYERFDEAKPSFSDLWAKIKPLIDMTVAFFNSLGLFKKQPK